MFPACVRRQDPVQEALRSVCGKTRQRFRVKKAFCFLCKGSFMLFCTNVSSHLSSPAMRHSVVTVAGEMCILSARGVCGSKILCKRPCIRSAENIVNGPCQEGFFVSSPAMRQCCNSCGRNVHFIRTWCVCGSKILCKRPCVRSAEKLVNGSVSRRLFVSFVKALLCFFPQTYHVSSPATRHSVVTVAGEMCILSARGVCGSKILCKRPCVRSAEKNVNGSVSRRLFVSFVKAHLCFFHKRIQPCILSRNAAQCCNSCGRNVHFIRAWCVRQQDPVQEALHSVCGKNRQRFRVKKAFCFLCEGSFVMLFPQTYAARYPVSQCGSVVTVAGEMCIFPARGVCGSKILCKRPCVRSAEKLFNGSV